MQRRVLCAQERSDSDSLTSTLNYRSSPLQLLAEMSICPWMVFCPQPASSPLAEGEADEAVSDNVHPSPREQRKASVSQAFLRTAFDYISPNEYFPCFFQFKAVTTRHPDVGMPERNYIVDSFNSRNFPAISEQIRRKQEMEKCVCAGANSWANKMSASALCFKANTPNVAINAI